MSVTVITCGQLTEAATDTYHDYLFSIKAEGYWCEGDNHNNCLPTKWSLEIDRGCYWSEYECNESLVAPVFNWQGKATI